MDIQTRKIEFTQAFLKLQSEELISLFENILSSETKEELKPMTIKDLNSRINQYKKDFENGDYKTHEEVFAKYN